MLSFLKGCGGHRVNQSSSSAIRCARATPASVRLSARRGTRSGLSRGRSCGTARRWVPDRLGFDRLPQNKLPEAEEMSLHCIGRT